MIYTNLTKKVMRFAFDKHSDQIDKSGIPYIFHPIHIAEQMIDEKTTVVALLHDVLEDTTTSEEELVKLGLDTEMIEAIKILTKPEDMEYFDYIESIKSNPIAKKVKMVDLQHNSDITRLNEVNDKDLKRIEKYQKAIKILINE